MLSRSLTSWFFEKIAKANARSVDITSLSKLTVVIPSYVRHEYLLRSIVFWSDSPARVIIVDGSKKCLPLEVREAIGSLKNILYLHQIDSINKRLTSAAQHIKTEYAVMMCDDEFLLEHGLTVAVKRLDTNQDFVGCIGRSIKFNWKHGVGMQAGPSDYHHQDYAICQNFIGDRLEAAMEDYKGATCYAVLRREVWVKAFSNIHDYSCPYAGEIQQGIITYSCGKLTSVNSLYWLRSLELDPIHDNKSFNRKLSFSAWWMNRKFVDEHAIFIERLTKELVLNGLTTNQEAQKVLDSAIQIYLKFERQQRYKGRNGLQKFYVDFRLLVNKFLSRDTIDIINRFLGRRTDYSIQVDFDLGTLDGFLKENWGGSYGLNEALVDELRSVENIIVQFNQLKSSSNSGDLE